MTAEIINFPKKPVRPLSVNNLEDNIQNNMKKFADNMTMKLTSMYAHDSSLAGIDIQNSMLQRDMLVAFGMFKVALYRYFRIDTNGISDEEIKNLFEKLVHLMAPENTPDDTPPKQYA